MLFHSKHNQFANKKLNPEREERLLWISIGKGGGGLEDDGNDEGNDRRKQGPEDGGQHGIARGIHSRITKGVLSSDVLDETLRTPSGLIALLEHENDDLREKIEQRIRSEEAEYYADQVAQEDLPMNEILWYLREHAEDAEALRAEALKRLQENPESLLRFTHNLHLQIGKLRDVEQSLGNVDAEQLLSYQTAPDANTQQEILNRITERSSASMTSASDSVKNRLVSKIREGFDWDNWTGSTRQTKRKRKLLGMFLAKEKEPEEAFDNRSLQDQVVLLQSHVIEMREVLREQLHQEATIILEEIAASAKKQFGTVDADSAIRDHGASQILLGKAVSDAVLELEQFIHSPPEATEPGFESYLLSIQEKIAQAKEGDLLGAEVREAKRKHEETVSWATALQRNGRISAALQALDAQPRPFVVQQMPQEQIEFLRHYLPALERVGSGNATGDDYDTVEMYLQDEEGALQLNTLIYTLTHTDVQNQLAQNVERYESRTIQNIASEREKYRSTFEKAKADLASNPAFSHEVCGVLHVQELLEEQYRQVLLDLTIADEHEQDRMGSDHLRRAVDTIERLAETDRLLRELDGCTIHRLPAEQFKSRGAGTTEAAGCYMHETGEILINIDKSKDPEKTITHEKGHAIVHILTRQTGLFTGILVSLHGHLNTMVPKNQLDGSTLSFQELLKKQAKKWGVEENRSIVLERARRQTHTEADAAALSEQLYQDLLMDELLNKHGDWVRDNRSNGTFNEEELTLFNHIDEMLQPESSSPFDKKSLERAKLPSERLYSGFEEDDGDDQDADKIQLLDVNGRLTELRTSINKVRFFYESFPQYKGELEPIYNEYHKHHTSIEKEFQTGKLSAEKTDKCIDIMDDHLSDVLEEINRLKTEKSNLSRVDASGRKGWRAFFDRMTIVSIMDVYKTMQQIGEDMKRVWERRGAAKQAAIGLGLTDWIPKSTPYAGRLQDEFRRRDKEAEQKEVNEWKEKLEDFDSYDLLEMLGRIRNRDQVKAIFFLLTDRGRMDWNDEGMWDTLNAISIYNMPKAACKRDDILRDKWLRKLIDEIWSDKDLYTQWRQKNDSAIENGKKEFTATVDQLSNVKGGLAAELKHQLELWAEKKNTGFISPDLNPHLYEEIVDYSMRNGKMSMEDKLFYLVRGVSDGILSIDRLRTLAGEKGGVLNIYPWIDYFYGKNNSLPEVQALATRLTEDGAGKQYTPGHKTTLWLHLENMRTESARQRISKAISGTRAENLDHEDVPTLVAQADWVNIDRMTGMISGTREKLSPEAIRNAYTGFGTKFKILAYLAEMDDKNVAQFTDKDADEAAKSIIAYIHMDNIFTRNASKGDRPQLTWNIIDTQKGPSTSNLVVGDYRDPQNAFVSDVLSEVGDDFWSTVNMSQQERDTLIRDAGNRNDLDGRAQEERYEKFTKTVFNRLQEELARDPERLKRILRKYAARFKEENYAIESDTDVQNHHINSKKVQDYFGERFASTMG